MATGETSPADYGDFTPEEWFAENGIDLSPNDYESTGIYEIEPSAAAHEIEPIHPLLQTIFKNYCETQKILGKSVNLDYCEDSLYYELETRDKGNKLVIFVKSEITKRNEHIDIGYYWNGEFIIYPELLSSELEDDVSMALDTLNLGSLQRRIAKIDDHKNDTHNTARFDYSHQAIQELYYEMSEFLDEEAINDLLEKHHVSVHKEDKPHTQLFADMHTRAVIGIRDKKATVEPDLSPKIEDGVITVKILGAFSVDDESGIKNRQDAISIDVAHRQAEMDTDKVSDFIKGEDYELPDFEDGFKGIEHRVPTYGYALETYVEIAQKVRILAAYFEEQNLKFDKQNVGVWLYPNQSQDFNI